MILVSLLAGCRRGSAVDSDGATATAAAATAADPGSAALMTPEGGDAIGVAFATPSIPGWQPGSAADLPGLCRLFVDSPDPIWGELTVRAVETRQAEAVRAEASDSSLADLHAELGRELLRLGRLEEAVAELDSAMRLGVQADRSLDWAKPVWLLAALAHIRIAEAATCRPDPTRCALGGAEAPWREVDSAQLALGILRDYLNMQPDRRRGLVAAWLVNVIVDLQGGDAAAVPHEIRIDTDRFGVQTRGDALEQMRMVNVATEAGVDAFDLAGGAVMDDFDGDGDLDLVSTTMDFCGGAHFFRNLGDGTFADETRESGLMAQPGVLNAVQADYDNDGDLDLYLMRGAWLFANGQVRNSLLANDGDGSFRDVTVDVGLAEPAFPSQAAAWADYDLDGDLDLYVGNEEAGAKLPFPAQLFRNDGSRFADVAAIAGVSNDRMAKGVAWGDYDNDGDPDLYVSNFGPNRLYENQGDGTFRDRALELGVEAPSERSFATWFFDYDNDGWLDLFVASSPADVDGVIESYLTAETTGANGAGVVDGVEDVEGAPRLYRNVGGGFKDVTTTAGLARPLIPMGANFGDVDGDGFQDIYLGTGTPGFEGIVPNVLLMNRQGGHFEDATTAYGLGLIQKGHGVAFGDIDGDLDVDLYHQLGGMYPGDRAANVLMRNDGLGSSWITLRLEGRASNRYGVGARVEVVADTPEGSRSYHALVDSGGSFGANSLQLELGLGDATAVTEVIVDWPGGARQTVGPLDLGAGHTVVEANSGSS